ncbi:MAG: divergent polysaccharide deacetylase family protein [Gammaproteobacteria bacterium]|jgi:hypothetical protein|nr:divergent polysaccharide deacetylase family protein [Gammaproteobacteria bacterium]
MHIRTVTRYFPITLWLCFQSAILFSPNAQSGEAQENLPGIALIIDDLGNQRELGMRAVMLPGPVACAFLPYGPLTKALASQAYAYHKEIMLHLPMQAVDQGNARVDEGTLTLDMTEQQFTDALAHEIAAVPYVSGLNNHKGSLLTRHPGNMAWLMQAINERGDLFFVDSRTTKETVASQLATEYGVPNISRNVFLDNDPDPEAVRLQFRKLIAIAKRDGTALGIGHPQTGTLDVLREELENLQRYGVQLLPVSRLIELQNERRLAWQMSLSH